MASLQKYQIRVHYPSDGERMVLRTEEDWERDLAPNSISTDRNCHEFAVHSPRPFLYFKPVLIGKRGRRWSTGSNFLAVGDSQRPLDAYPSFDEDNRCSACELREIADGVGGRRHAYRVFYPPGYDENTLQRYPVLYMQDGQNLFFPHEAFQGAHWKIAETLTLLDDMNAIRPAIVVGIYPNARESDYTRPGYHEYGRFIAEVLKPEIDAGYRTLTGASSTAVMGSSLGGVVSFYLAWQYPQLFGMAACMSSTFGWRDDLFERVVTEPRRPCRFYLDSGWPADNYEVTRRMRNLMLRNGYQDGVDLHYFAFPEARHNEQHWALRAHMPFQLFFDEQRDAPAGAASWGPTAIASAGPVAVSARAPVTG